MRRSDASAVEVVTSMTPGEGPPGALAPVVSGAVSAPDASCWECAEGEETPPLVYALGRLGHTLGTEARADALRQAGVSDPRDEEAILRYLEENPGHADAVQWTLTQDSTPFYAIQPGGAFASETYARLREYFAAQVAGRSEMVSVPGWVHGSAVIGPGQKVPVIWPALEGMCAWSTRQLTRALAGRRPARRNRKAAAIHATKVAEIESFLARVFHELRNFGLSAEERALNFAATRAFEMRQIFEPAFRDGLALAAIDVEPAPLCRPGSSCWDVELTFFDPAKRLERAREIYRLTVDVSEVVPVTIGRVRNWSVY